jgi:tRNA-(ms[2]io[6]A)-hydroxylase
MESEAVHYTTFITLAEFYLPKDTVRARWKEWLQYEAQVMQELEVRGDRVH